MRSLYVVVSYEYVVRRLKYLGLSEDGRSDMIGLQLTVNAFYHTIGRGMVCSSVDLHCTEELTQLKRQAT